MHEKAIIALGCLIGAAAACGFYLAAEQLSLPPLLFFLVDVFGVLAGSVIFGLLSIPLAIGLLVLAIDWCFPQRPEPPGR